MSIDLGKDFATRWQATNSSVRQAIVADLKHIHDLFETQTPFTDWLIAQNNIAVSPAVIEARIIELKKQFLQDADRLIDQVLAPIREELRHWLYAEIDYLGRGNGQVEQP